MALEMSVRNKWIAELLQNYEEDKPETQENMDPKCTPQFDEWGNVPTTR